MKLAIISGSHRHDSQSGRISHVLSERVSELSLFESVDILSLSDNPLPLWDESIWAGDEDWKAQLAPWKTWLNEADALVVVAPEWNGMVPAGLKNFFLLFGSAELGHKPALITALSAGLGGAYPVVELRSSSYKNCRICYLPDHLIVRHVTKAFTGEDPEGDQRIQDRADYCLKLLREYSLGLKAVRESGVVDHRTFGNGM
ncbi:MAG: NADPH-dependent FMN reductase [Endozoicomonas sp.]